MIICLKNQSRRFDIESFNQGEDGRLPALSPLGSGDGQEDGAEVGAGRGLRGDEAQQVRVLGPGGVRAARRAVEAEDQDLQPSPYDSFLDM